MPVRWRRPAAWPERAQAVATFLYMEMLKHGYTAVGEFHYVHHRPDGVPYEEPNELAIAVIVLALITLFLFREGYQFFGDVAMDMGAVPTRVPVGRRVGRPGCRGCRGSGTAAPAGG